jgi:hypothetical protein
MQTFATCIKDKVHLNGCALTIPGRFISVRRKKHKAYLDASLTETDPVQAETGQAEVEAGQGAQAKTAQPVQAETAKPRRGRPPKVSKALDIDDIEKPTRILRKKI